MKSYDYAHRSGVRWLSWDDFASLSRRMAEMLELHHPQLILGIARAGLFPATAVACSLRCELLPIRLTRRVDDRVVYPTPVWRVPIPADVKGKVLAIVDEIADTGMTLDMARHATLALGAQQVVTASLVSHSWADPKPEFAALVTDEFVVFPWDAQVLDHGTWVTPPEIEAGLAAQA